MSSQSRDSNLPMRMSMKHERSKIICISLAKPAKFLGSFSSTLECRRSQMSSPHLQRDQYKSESLPNTEIKIREYQVTESDVGNCGNTLGTSQKLQALYCLIPKWRSRSPDGPFLYIAVRNTISPTRGTRLVGLMSL